MGTLARMGVRRTACGSVLGGLLSEKEDCRSIRTLYTNHFDAWFQSYLENYPLWFGHYVNPGFAVAATASPLSCLIDSL
jgi:hypothetical protein